MDLFGWKHSEKPLMIPLPIPGQFIFPPPCVYRSRSCPNFHHPRELSSITRRRRAVDDFINQQSRAEHKGAVCQDVVISQINGSPGVLLSPVQALADGRDAQRHIKWRSVLVVSEFGPVHTPDGRTKLGPVTLQGELCIGDILLQVDGLVILLHFLLFPIDL